MAWDQFNMMDVLPSIGCLYVDVGPHVEQLLHLSEEPSTCCHHQRRGPCLTVPVVHWIKEYKYEETAFYTIRYYTPKEMLTIIVAFLSLLF